MVIRRGKTRVRSYLCCTVKYTAERDSKSKCSGKSPPWTKIYISRTPTAAQVSDEQHSMCGCLKSVFIFLFREEPGVFDLESFF